MRPIGPLGTIAVGTVVVGMVTGTVVVAHERSDVSPPTSTEVHQPAARKQPDLRLTATPRVVDAGASVALRIRTSTKHPRTVRVQRWDAARTSWRQVTKRKVRAGATVRVRPTTGSTRYRAVAPRVRHRAGAKKSHVHRAARSTAVTVTARAPRNAGHRPAALTGDEKALLNAVVVARRAHARPAVTAAGDDGADACLTTYAREHSAWMAQQGRALDPGSPEHRAARRPMPATACPGNTVWTVTRAIGHGSLTAAVSGTVDAWLSSPYGETTRLLTACHDAPVFEFGVAALSSDGTRWFTALVASDTGSTKSAGVC